MRILTGICCLFFNGFCFSLSLDFLEAKKRKGMSSKNKDWSNIRRETCKDPLVYLSSSAFALTIFAGAWFSSLITDIMTRNKVPSSDHWPFEWNDIWESEVRGEQLVISPWINLLRKKSVAFLSLVSIIPWSLAVSQVEIFCILGQRSLPVFLPLRSPLPSYVTSDSLERNSVFLSL
jgi:hypothetical protein